MTYDSDDYMWHTDKIALCTEYSRDGRWSILGDRYEIDTLLNRMCILLNLKQL